MKSLIIRESINNETDLSTNRSASELALGKRVPSKRVLRPLFAALGIAGAALVLTPAAVGAANVADIAQLTNTGICRACDLSGADLTGAHLIGADLRDANLTGTVLTHANLEGADLTGAKLINTDLSNAYLTNAVLDNAVVTNVDLSDSTLIYTSMENTQVDNVE
ncbi:MAG: pentapeptide repeat-containing protein, partial [Bacteroidota bacterium]